MTIAKYFVVGGGVYKMGSSTSTAAVRESGCAGLVDLFQPLRHSAYCTVFSKGISGEWLQAWGVA